MSLPHALDEFCSGKSHVSRFQQLGRPTSWRSSIISAEGLSDRCEAGFGESMNFHEVN